MATNQMSKPDFVKYFEQDIAINIPRNDKPALRQAWNDTIDLMAKNGDLRDSARNWRHLKYFY